MSNDECLYYALIFMIPLAIVIAMIWAMYGPFEDELKGYDE